MDLQQVFKDPEFHALPIEERRKFMSTADPDFAGLQGPEQDKFLNKITPSTVTKPNIPTEIPSSGVEKFMAGMGKGFVDIGRGVGERVGLVTPQEVAESRKVDQPLMESTPGKVGHFAGSVLPWMAVPGSAPASLLGRIGVGAAMGAGAGLIQPTTEKESPALNTALGATTGAVLPVGLAGASKVYNAIKEPVKGAISDLSRKFGIPTTLGEVTQNPIVKKVESWLEEIPIIGLRKYRQKQQVRAEEAAKDFIGQFIHDPNASNVMESNRTYASSLFNDMKQLLPGIDQQKILPSQSRQIASDLLDRYPDIFKKFQDTKMEGLINNIVSSTQGKVTPMATLTGGPSITPKTLTFDEAWTLRQGLGEIIGQARKKIASGEVNETQLSQLKSLFGAVSKDMESWATGIGRTDVKDAFNIANEGYKQFVVRYDKLQRVYDKAIVKVGNEEFISPQRLAGSLKRDIIDKDKYIKKFTPQQIQEMAGLENIMRIVHRAGQFKENPGTGLRWGLPIFGGGTIGGAAALGSTLTGAGVVGGIVSLTTLAKFLTGTEAGKRLVLSASKIEPTSPAFQKIVNEVYSQLPKIAGVAGAQFGSSKGLPPGISTGNPPVVSSPPPPKIEATKVLDGKTYTKINGKWMEE